MSEPSKLSNLSDAEKSIKDKQGSNEKDSANTPEDKDNKGEKSDMQSEGGSK